MRISVIDQDGKRHELDGRAGLTAMEAMRGANMTLRAECGGSCACATCHVYVGEAWQDKLPSADSLETDLLDMAFEVRENSRLSCQIILKEDLDGIELTLAPGTD